MMERGARLPPLRCAVAGRATLLDDVAPGEHLVVYIAGTAVSPIVAAAGSRWPLPTRPRTTFLVVDAAPTTHGFIRAQMVEDVSREIRKAIGPPDSVLRAVILSPDRSVVAIVDADVGDAGDAVAVRSGVSVALSGTPSGTIDDPVERSGDDDDPKRAGLFSVLADRAEMVHSPLVARTQRVVTIAGYGPRSETIQGIVVVLHFDCSRSEAIERLVGLGYDYVGDLGLVGRDLLRSPADEPRHQLHIVDERSRYASFADGAVGSPEEQAPTNEAMLPGGRKP